MRNITLSRLASSLALIAAVTMPLAAMAAPARADLRGKILLQVESKGEAWWVEPGTGERISLGRPSDAYAVMRAKGVGITNANIWLIPIGYRTMAGTDTDGDGLTDAFEQAIGTKLDVADTDGDGFSDKSEIEGRFNPYSATDKSLTGSAGFTAPHLGKIFLQVESRGEAWWVNPADGKRYFLGRAADAFDLMRGFGLGISNADLAKITVSAFVPPAAPATPAPTTPAVTPEPTPIGSGYTLNTVTTYSDPAVINLIWDWFPQTGTTSSTKLYVDDVGKRLRSERIFGDIRYVQFVQIVGDEVLAMQCRYTGVSGSMPQCKVVTGNNPGVLNDLFPSTASHPSKEDSGTRLADSTVLGKQAQCYSDKGETICVYDDNSSVTVYALGFGSETVASSYVIGRPADSLFAMPADYDAWDEQVPAATAPLGSGFTLKLTGTHVSAGADVEIWGTFVEKGNFTQIDYVDDVGKTRRSEVTYGTHRYVEYETYEEAKVELLRCRYLDIALKPACQKETLNYGDISLGGFHPPEAAHYPTLSGHAALKLTGKLGSRVIAEYPAVCYHSVEAGIDCFYGDWYSMNVYSKDADTTVQATEIIVGQPNASLFTWPTDYDAWP